MQPYEYGHPYSKNFYPRPPRGGRPLASASNNCFGKFLSTPSARRATERTGSCVGHKRISIHALREEGDGAGLVLLLCHLEISIHALREEGDPAGCC